MLSDMCGYENLTNVGKDCFSALILDGFLNCEVSCLRYRFTTQVFENHIITQDLRI